MIHVNEKIARLAVEELTQDGELVPVDARQLVVAQAVEKVDADALACQLFGQLGNRQRPIVPRLPFANQRVQPAYNCHTRPFHVHSTTPIIPKNSRHVKRYLHLVLDNGTKMRYNCTSYKHFGARCNRRYNG